MSRSTLEELGIIKTPTQTLLEKLTEKEMENAHLQKENAALKLDVAVLQNDLKQRRDNRGLESKLQREVDRLTNQVQACLKQIEQQYNTEKTLRKMIADLIEKVDSMTTVVAFLDTRQHKSYIEQNKPSFFPPARPGLSSKTTDIKKPQI